MSAILRPTRALRAGGGVLLVTVCTMLSACGADADGPSLTAGQAAELQRSIGAARGGAERDDRAAVHVALERFRSDVRRLTADGALSPDQAEVLLSGAEQAKRRVEFDIAPVPSPGDVPADGRGEHRDEEDEDDKEDKKKTEKEKKEDHDEEGGDG